MSKHGEKKANEETESFSPTLSFLLHVLFVKWTTFQLFIVVVSVEKFSHEEVFNFVAKNLGKKGIKREKPQQRNWRTCSPAFSSFPLYVRFLF